MKYFFKKSIKINRFMWKNGRISMGLFLLGLNKKRIIYRVTGANFVDFFLNNTLTAVSTTKECKQCVLVRNGY